MATLPDLTFGIKLEFVVVWPNSPCPPHEALFYALLGANIPVTGCEPAHNADKALETFAKAFTHWRISEDSEQLSRAEREAWPEHHDVECVELSSRKFSFANDDWKKEVQSVLDVLARVENFGCRFINNKSSGFHVHVGQGTSPLSLRTGKNLLQFCTAFERLLDNIHATNRILYPREFKYDHYHIPLSWFHQHNHVSRPGTNLYDWLRGIENLKTAREMVNFFILDQEFSRSLNKQNIAGRHPLTHNSAVNIENLSRRPHMEDQIKGTVEFRQHAGTRDMLAIMHWVEVTVRMVEFCRKEEPATFIAFLALGIDSTFELGELLDAIDVDAKTIQYYAPRTGGTDTTIGFLGKEGEEARRDWTEMVDEVIVANHHEEDQRQDRTSAWRDAAVAAKNYGYAPRLLIRDQHGGIVEPAVTRCYDQIESTVEWRVVDDEAMMEAAERDIRRGVFDRLSEVLRAGEQGLVEEENVKDAETGPVVWIGRHEVLVQDLEGMGLHGVESRGE